MKSIHIAGGDKRQLFLSEMLKQKGYRISMQGFEKAGIESRYDDADIVFLPVPYRSPDGFIKAPFSDKKLKLDDVVSRYRRSLFVLGRCDDNVKNLIGERCFDLLEDESFLIENAALSAEGAILGYQNYAKHSLIGARCLVVGFGRISKLLCSMLGSFTDNITATARKDKDLALIRAAHLGCDHTANLKEIVKDYDVIFNTVPYHVFGKSELGAINKSTVFIELASPPYGCDMELAKTEGVDVRIEPGIPGRFFPKAAAKAIMRTFEREEKKGWN